MEKFFFSDRNVTRQSGELEKMLNITNPESKRKCKKFLVQQMQEIYKRYGNKKPPHINTGQFLDELNK